MKTKKFDLSSAIIGAMQYTVFFLLLALLISYMFDITLSLKHLIYQNIFYYMITSFIFVDAGIRGAHVQNQKAAIQAKKNSKRDG